MKGIAFSPAMLKAFRNGTKSVTRRLVKRPAGFSDDVWNAAIPHPEGDRGCGPFGRDPYLRVWADDANGRVGERIRCPHVAGDKLWVKEALLASPNGLISYWSDGTPFIGECGPVAWGWKPLKLAAMYCPRWASRDTIEITSVRVERLHEITEEDAIAEGVEPSGAGSFYVRDAKTELAEFESARTAFLFLWDGINGRKAPSESNPFVWVLSFRRAS